MREAGEETRIEIGPLVVDTLKRLVTKNGEPVRLTPKEYELLALLIRYAGRVVTHRQLLAGVWGPAHVEDTQYLRVFIGQLRGKIEPDPWRTSADPHGARRRLPPACARTLIGHKLFAVA